jgi:transposase
MAPSLVNLETGMPVDLLPDRQAATLETWLKHHPGVLLISRDRAGEFARGAKAGAPEALQTADRFHVLRNLAEVVEKVRGLASPGSESRSSGDNSGNFSLPLAPALAS